MHPSLSACIREVVVAGCLSIFSFQHDDHPVSVSGFEALVITHAAVDTILSCSEC
jgi:hypothetical protein